VLRFCEHGNETLGSLKGRNIFRSWVTIIIQGKLTVCNRFVTLRFQLNILSDFFMTFNTTKYFLCAYCKRKVN